MSYVEDMALVVRERVTTEHIQKLDTHEIVDLIHGLEDQIESAPELLEGCQWFMEQLDEGVLVRDISRDGESGWAMRMMRFTAQLGKVAIAIQRAEDTT